LRWQKFWGGDIKKEKIRRNIVALLTEILGGGEKKREKIGAMSRVAPNVERCVLENECI
jgi:hypothetical protein